MPSRARRAALLPWLLPLLLVPSAPAPTGSIEDELLQNPGFEDGLHGWATVCAKQLRSSPKACSAASPGRACCASSTDKTPDTICEEAGLWTSRH